MLGSECRCVLGRPVDSGSCFCRPGQQADLGTGGSWKGLGRGTSPGEVQGEKKEPWHGACAGDGVLGKAGLEEEEVQVISPVHHHRESGFYPVRTGSCWRGLTGAGGGGGRTRPGAGSPGGQGLASLPTPQSLGQEALCPLPRIRSRGSEDRDAHLAEILWGLCVGGEGCRP